MKFLKVSPAAARELLKARKWYADQNPVTAADFVAKVEAAIQALADFPERYATYMRGTRRVFVEGFPYFVVYRVLADVIEVLGVVHNRRRPGYWLRRLK